MKTTNLQTPWRVMVRQYSNQKPSAWVITTRYGGVIAETNNLTNDTIPRLIASAPDLLSALQDICAMVVSPNDTRADILAHARAAIAKAEGAK